MSRTDEANGRVAVVLQVATSAPEPEYAGAFAEPDDSESSPPPRNDPDPDAADAGERARLIDLITRLIRGPTVPESTRLAGLTLIGWLARRRPEEPAHAVGVEEARKSVRRLQAARAKAR